MSAAVRKVSGKRFKDPARSLPMFFLFSFLVCVFRLGRETTKDVFDVFVWFAAVCVCSFFKRWLK